MNTCDRYCASMLQNALSADNFNVVPVQEIVSFSGSFTREVTNIILYALKTKIRNRIQPPRGIVTGAL